MPHVALVPFTGFRVREEELLALGMSLPGLQPRAAAIGQLPALGLLTLAGMLPEKWTCSLHETQKWDDAFVDEVLAVRPTLVALSALTASVEEAYQFSQRLRRRGVQVVLGGLHATACPSEAMNHCSVVAGEGEPVWHQLLADAEKGEMQPVYRSSGPFPLAQAPVPRFELLGGKSRPRLTLQTQRGCPLACEFCAASRLLGSFREKPTANIRTELEAMCRMFPRPVIELADDNTFAGSRDPDLLFEALRQADAKYFTEVDWRIGERPDVLQGLANSGCVQVLVGLESMVFHHSGMGAKQAKLERVMAALRAVQETGVAVIGCFIIGCDGETEASLERLAQYALDCPLADIQITIQTPFPGTALHRRLEKQGRLLPDRGWSHYTLFDVAYKPDSMSVKELELGFRRLTQAVFSKEATARRQRIRREIWSRNPRFRSCAFEPCSSI